MTSPPANGPPTRRLQVLVRSLSHRNYRLFVAGQSISLVGTWLQHVAMTWLVYRLTDSPFWLGITSFCGQIPTFFLAPVAGVWTDRASRRHVLLVTQTLAMLQALTLAGLALSGWIAVWQVLLLAVFLGMVNAFDITTRQAFLSEMLGNRADLSNAIALNSSLVNGARLVGPSLAGILISVVGEGVCFLLNGVSYLAALAALLLMRLPPRPPVVAQPALVEGLREGFRYAFGFAPIRALLLLLALVSFVGAPYTVLMPIFATDVLGGGPKTLGLLMSAAGVGALVAALYLASRTSVRGLGTRVALSPAVFGTGLIAFSFARSLGLALAFVFVAGFALMVQMASSNTILQTIVEDDKRGRVMSFYTMAFMGTVPLGSLAAGSLASRLGAPATLRLGGLVCLAGSLVFLLRLPAWREQVRPIYRRLGILPPLVTEGDPPS